MPDGSWGSYTARDIPPAWFDWHINDDPLLLWVRSGALTALTDDAEHRVEAGAGIWFPAGVHHAMRLEPGTAALWAASTRGQDAPDEVRVVPVPAVWGDWLIHKRFLGPSTHDTPLLELATQPSRRLPPDAPTIRLPMPRSRQAQAVAQALLRTPGAPLRIEDHAAGQRISAKTLERQFTRETGLGFAEWRTRARIRSAARLLAEGRGVAAAQRHAGYTTPAGFTRGFHRHLGMTPTAYTAFTRSRIPLEDTAPAMHVLTLLTDEAAVPPPIPPYIGPMRVNDCHVLLWVHRGDARIRIGTSDRHLTRGDAIWVPAGVSHLVELAADSILFPVGNRYGRVRTNVEDLRVFSFPTGAEDYLLHVYLAEYYDLFHPESRPTLVDELFQQQFIIGTHDRGALTGIVGTVATALRRDPADPRSLADWAKTLGTTPSALGKEFTSQTGATFPHWRAQLRMNIARELLHLGERPGQIAHRLGYARSSAFTKVFTEMHGIPPSEYQRRETGHTGAAESPDSSA